MHNKIEINSQKDKPKDALSLSNSYFLDGKIDEAIITLQSFIAQMKQDLNQRKKVSYAFDLLAQCYEAKNKDVAALKCYKTALKLNAFCSSAWHNMGLLYVSSAEHYLEQNLKSSEKLFWNAQSFLRKALEICGNNPVFLQSLASWYEKHIQVLEKINLVGQDKIGHHFNEAIRYYQKAIGCCAKDDLALQTIILENLIECLAQYGHFLYKKGAYERAKEMYLETTKLDPNHLIAINQLGMAFFKLRDYAQARQCFFSILKKTDDRQEHADVWLNVACSYRLEKKWEKAENAINHAKTFSPNDSSIAAEEENLVASKKSAMLVAAPQTFFGSTKSASVNIENTPTYKPIG